MMLQTRKDAHHPDCTDCQDFEQLCALASSGALTAGEWTRLAAHLKSCRSCREQLAKYQEIATFGMSLVAPNDVSLEIENEWSPESAVAKLMRTLQEQQTEATPIVEPRVASANAQSKSRAAWFSFPNWALPYATAAAVLAAMSVTAYFSGFHSGERRVNAQPDSGIQAGSTLDVLLRQRTELEHQLELRSVEMQKMSGELLEEKTSAEKLRAEKKAADDTINAFQLKVRDNASENALLHSQYEAAEAERVALSEKLRESETRHETVRRTFEALRDQHAADLAQIAKLESDIASASQQARPAQYVEAQQISPSEPDLSALMGARDLFIADVYDIDKTGSPRKPFGRVFYTKGKSLLFYAFDLDHQPGVKAASTFQVWGRRGYGDTHPLNMGMMYMDSETSNRWVLKYDNAKALSQVDAVFVTIEPHGGSDMPKGRQLLYASLRTPPNHP